VVDRKKPKRGLPELIDLSIQGDEPLSYRDLFNSLTHVGIGKDDFSLAIRQLKEEGKIILENDPSDKRTYLIRRVQPSTETKPQISKLERGIIQEINNRVIPKPDDFTSDELKLIKHLADYSDRDPDRWGTIQSLGEKMAPDAPLEGVKRIGGMLSTLTEKLLEYGVNVNSRKSELLEGETVYAIQRKQLKKARLDQLLISEKKNTTLLLIGDAAFAHIYHSPVIDKGIRYFLEKNNLIKKIDATLLITGMPFIPDRGGGVNDQYLAVLRKKSLKVILREAEERKNQKQADGKDDIIEEDKTLIENDPEYERKHVKHIITTIPEAVENAAESLETMLGDKYKGEVHYFFGYKDQKHLQTSIRRFRADFNQLQKEQEKHKLNAEKIDEEKKKQQKIYQQFKDGTKLVRELHSSITKRTSGSLESRITDFKGRREEEFAQLEKDSPEIHKELAEFLSKVSSQDELTSYLNSKIAKRDELNNKIKALKEKYDAEIQQGADIEQAKRSFSLYKFTGYMPTNAQQFKIHHHRAMTEYQDQLMSLWKKWKRKRFIHPDETDLEIGGYLIRIDPQMNRASTTPGNKTVKLQQRKIRAHQTDDRPVPDLYISSMDKGGYRFFIMPQQREKTLEGEFADSSESICYVKMPTLQASESLEYCQRNKLDKLPDVKNFMAKNWASGIVILNLSPNGIRQPIGVFEESLKRMGLLAEQYELIEQKLKQKDLTNLEKIDLERTKSFLENSFRIEPNIGPDFLKKIDLLLMPESHHGSQNPLGNTFNTQLVEAVVKYEEERKLSMIVFGGDNIHGDHNAKSMRTATIDLGLLPHEIKKLTTLIREDKSTAAEQKESLLAQLAYMMRGTQPINSSSKQLLDYADNGAVQLAEQVIDNGGLAVAISGNHYNSSNNLTHDEALMISLAFDRKYRTSGRLKILDGIGERDGRGDVDLSILATKMDLMTPKEFGTMFAAHSFPNKSDPLFGMMEKVVGMGLTAHIIQGNHLHTAGVGYADGKHFIMSPGGQSKTKYVDTIGEMCGFRGAMNVEFSRNPDLYQGYQEATFAPLGYLQEHFLDEETWTQQMIVEKYIPLVKDSHYQNQAAPKKELADKETIEKYLHLTRGHIITTAKHLGVSRWTIDRRIREYKIDLNKFK